MHVIVILNDFLLIKLFILDCKMAFLYANNDQNVFFLRASSKHSALRKLYIFTLQCRADQQNKKQDKKRVYWCKLRFIRNSRFSWCYF